MYFELEHLFEAPIEVVEAAMFHPDYPGYLRTHHEVLANVSPQSLEDDGANVRRRIHYQSLPTFEHIGVHKVPAGWFEFVEESVWNKEEHKLVFSHFPVVDEVRDHVSTQGEISLERLADGRTLRRTRTEIKVKNVPFLLRAFGRLAEQMLSREARRMLDTEARVLEKWLLVTQVHA